MSSPFVLVIFGATGDLARHKLIPALFWLYKRKKLGKKFYIVGFARREFTDSEYAKFLGDELRTVDDDSWKEFARNIYYQQGLFDDSGGYEQLIGKLATFDKEIGGALMRIFYLAAPPDNYSTILSYLQSTKLSLGQDQGSPFFTRIAIEKPFGKDLKNAQELEKKLCSIFQEQQTYRIDHYLAKETVQTMIAFRFANSIFEPVWNKEHIDQVQITWMQKEGIEGRGKLFDGLGILRDIGQNHLMQLLATIAMEQPISFSREHVRDQRAQAIKAIRKISKSDVDKYVVAGQYEGYNKEPNVAKDSCTETFIGVKLFVDTPRFEGVPFYLRAGKGMAKEVMDIKIVFKQTCHILFKEYGCPEIGNVITIRIQPDEGIGIRAIVKTPGTALSLSTVDLKFSYKETFSSENADAYEKVLLDILSGDQMLFNRSDEVASSWELISEILLSWQEKGTIPYIYKRGSEGPNEAFKLLEADGREWL